MKLVVQVVKRASVEVESRVVGSISTGFLVLIGIENSDTFEDADILISKLVNLRTFKNEDVNKYFDLSLIDIKGESLLVSQFTLAASFKKGKRPEFIMAMIPNDAKKLYEYFVEKYKLAVNGLKVETGVFGAEMQVDLVNDGPITYIISSDEFKKNNN
jgi:D-tyrosyl-tRNA(Tyr) deacylase